MERFAKISLAVAGAAPFVIEEGELVSLAVADGQINFAEVGMIVAIPAGAAITAFVYFLGGLALRIRTQNGEMNGAPVIGNTRRRDRGRRRRA